MEDSKEIGQLKRIAAEALEMLEDRKYSLGLFDGQRFSKLKGQLSEINRMTCRLSSGLSEIDASDD